MKFKDNWPKKRLRELDELRKLLIDIASFEVTKMIDFHLRYYQSEAVSAVYAEWECGVRSTAIIACTGGGKTEMYLNIGVREPGRVLVLVHRDYLIQQPIDRLASHGFVDVAVEKAEEKSEVGSLFTRGKIVFASVQSIGPSKQMHRLETFDPSDFSLVIIDEAHRSTAVTYRRVLDHFGKNPKCRVLIVTATPKRKDGVALGNVCESVAYTYGPATAMKEGWIVPTRFFRREVKDLDFSQVRMKGADLDPDQMQEAMMQERPLHEFCASLADFSGPSIIFVPKRDIGFAYAEMMNRRYRPGRARMIDQETRDEERTAVGKMLERGELDYLFNVNIVTEGYDLPLLQRVIWAAPTASLVRYTQGVGRVFRPHSSIKAELYGDREESERRRSVIEASEKPFGEVVTYYPQNCRHQLCDPVDILGGDELPDDLSIQAKRVQDETARLPGGSDTEEDLETARVMLEFKSVLDRRLKEVKAKAEYVDTEFNPMNGERGRVGSTPNRPRDGELAVDMTWPKGNPISPKQAKWFRWKCATVEQISRLTKWRAMVVRDLYESGVWSLNDAINLPKRQAVEAWDKIKAKVVNLPV